MRNRLIAAILGLFGTLTGVQAAPDVTSEITYDLASGRADYYFWKRRQEIMDICGMNVRILTSNKPVQLMEIYRQYKSI